MILFFKMGVYFRTFTCVKENWEYIAVEESKLQSHWMFVTSPNRLQSIEGAYSLSNSTFNLGQSLSITVNPATIQLIFILFLQWTTSGELVMAMLFDLSMFICSPTFSAFLVIVSSSGYNRSLDPSRRTTFINFISFILHWGRSSGGLNQNICIIFQLFHWLFIVLVFFLYSRFYVLSWLASVVSEIIYVK